MNALLYSQDWTSDVLGIFFRSVKCTNLRNNVSSCAASKAKVTECAKEHSLIILLCKERETKPDMQIHTDR